MTSVYGVHIEIRNEDKVHKQIKESINFASLNLTKYVDVLRSIKQTVNAALTELVDKENSNDTALDEGMEDDDDAEESDVDDKPLSTAKRKLPLQKDYKKFKRDKQI